jgi:hypothetical protein
MELTFTTPSLLFPAISLLVLAYTNRFLATASLIRSLHDKYKLNAEEGQIVLQIRNLRTRIRLIRYMQALGVISFLFCIICMLCIFMEWKQAAIIIFSGSIVSFIISLIISLMEISLSTKALELELSDMEELSRSNLFTEFLGSKEDKKLN